MSTQLGAEAVRHDEEATRSGTSHERTVVTMPSGGSAGTAHALYRDSIRE
jgi:hypothetical protein